MILFCLKIISAKNNELINVKLLHVKLNIVKFFSEKVK